MISRIILIFLLIIWFGQHFEASDTEPELKVSPPLKATPTFPKTIQSSDRILVSITSAYQNRIHYLQRQLTHYTHACEQGYEIHILIVSRVQGWGQLPLFNTPGLFRCNRLHNDLPIRFFDNPPIKEHLAFYHRPIFQQLQANYDFFICQEDDIFITTANLNYFVRYEGKLRGTDMLPTFAMYEIPFQYPLSAEMKERYPVQSQTWPRVYETSTHKLQINAHIVRKDSDYYLMPYKTYCASYMIPRWVLEKFSDRKAWLGDEHKPWLEYNVHFNHMWLNRYFYMVLPISPWFEHAFIHHSSNRYVNEFFTKTDPALGKVNISDSNHDFAVDVNEVGEFLMDAFDNHLIHGDIKDDGGTISKFSRINRAQRTHGLQKILKKMHGTSLFTRPEQPWKLDIIYTNFEDITVKDHGRFPLRACVDSAGKTARIEPHFYGKFPESFFERKARVMVRFQCWDKRDALFTQEAAKCKKADKSYCESGFGNDVKPFDGENS
jgi:hypothetical protein